MKVIGKYQISPEERKTVEDLEAGLENVTKELNSTLDKQKYRYSSLLLNWQLEKLAEADKPSLYRLLFKFLLFTASIFCTLSIAISSAASLGILITVLLAIAYWVLTDIDRRVVYLPFNLAERSLRKRAKEDQEYEQTDNLRKKAARDLTTDKMFWFCLPVCCLFLLVPFGETEAAREFVLGLAFMPYLVFLPVLAVTKLIKNIRLKALFEQVPQEAIELIEHLHSKLKLIKKISKDFKMKGVKVTIR